MSDYILREISFGDNKMEVIRKRTNSDNNPNHIRIRVGTEVITFSSDDYGDNYELEARKLIDLLDEAVNHPCSISLQVATPQIENAQSDEQK